MKEEIINTVMVTIRLYQMREWDEKSAQDFCEFVLDGEGFDYTDEDFKNLNYGYADTNAFPIIMRYAKMYCDIYKEIDLPKAEEMKRVYDYCNNTLSITKEIDDIFHGKAEEPKEKIEITKGESITFSNGAGRNLSPEEIEQLVKMTWGTEEAEQEKRK